MSDEHKLHDVEQEDLAGSPWIGYCMCGAIFNGAAESEVGEAHRNHVDNKED